MNTLLMSREHRDDLAGSRLQLLIKLANVKESFTQCEEYNFKLNKKIQTKIFGSLGKQDRLFI